MVRPKGLFVLGIKHYSVKGGPALENWNRDLQIQGVRCCASLFGVFGAQQFLGRRQLSSVFRSSVKWRVSSFGEETKRTRVLWKCCEGGPKFQTLLWERGARSVTLRVLDSLISCNLRLLQGSCLSVTTSRVLQSSIRGLRNGDRDE